MVAAAVVTYYTAGTLGSAAATWAGVAGGTGEAVVSGAVGGFFGGAVASHGDLRGAIIGGVTGVAFTATSAGSLAPARSTTSSPTA